MNHRTNHYFGIVQNFCLLSITVLCACNLHAELIQTPKMAAQTRWAVETIQSKHYLRDQIDDLDGQAVVTAYMKLLDPQHIYFNQEDKKQFLFRFGSAIEAFLNKGNHYAAFEIYALYKERFTQRAEWINQFIERDFTFTSHMNFIPDRRDSKWPKDAAAANSLWEKRIEYELLEELLSLASDVPLSSKSSASDEEEPAADQIEQEKDTFDPRKLNRLLEDPDFFGEILKDARKKLRRRYQRKVRLVKEREASDIQEAFINAMTQLFDPHSSFLSSDSLESFETGVNNSFVGIGAMLQDDDGICTITRLIAGGPAERSNLLSRDDQILAVAQGLKGDFEDVVDMQLRYIVRKIKGEKGSFVRLRIRPGDAVDPSTRKDVTIQRDEVKLTSNLASAQLIEVPKNNEETVAVGVIDLPSFMEILVKEKRSPPLRMT